MSQTKYATTSLTLLGLPEIMRLEIWKHCGWDMNAYPLFWNPATFCVQIPTLELRDHMAYDLFEYRVATLLWSMMVNSYAAELTARVQAGEAVKKNTDDLIADLNVAINRINQEKATNEVLEMGMLYAQGLSSFDFMSLCVNRFADACSRCSPSCSFVCLFVCLSSSQ